MKNKTFFQLNFFWQMISLFMLLCGIGSIYGVILFTYGLAIKIDFFSISCLIVLLFTALFCLYTFIRLEHNILVLDNDCVFVPDDWMWKEHKIQFQTTVNYNEIMDIKLIRSSKNSNNKKIVGRSPSSGALKPYMEFVCKDGNTKRIFIMYFTKKQIIQIVNQIKERMILCGNTNFINDTSEIVSSLPKGGIVI